MAILFANTTTYGSRLCSAFDGATAVSYFVRCKLASLQSVAQYLFRLYGPNGQLNVRREPGTPGSLKTTLTATNGVFCTQNPAGDAVAGTVFDIAVSWVPNSSSGFRYWRDGTEAAAASTTSQNGYVFAPGSGASLEVARRQSGSNPLYGGLESLLIVVGHAFDQDDVDALRRDGHPYSSRLMGKTMGFWRFYGGLLTRVPDLGGQDLHFEAANLVGTLASDGDYGSWDEAHVDVPDPSGPVGTFTPPPAPGPWTDAGSESHPTATHDVSGLDTAEQYDFRVRAVDAAGNASGWSATVSSYPAPDAPAYAVHVPRMRRFGRR